VLYTIVLAMSKITGSPNRASRWQRLAAIFCLAAIVFAVVRIVQAHAQGTLSDFWRAPFYTKYFTALMLPLGLYAAGYIVITGKVPPTSAFAIKIDEVPWQTSRDRVYMVVVWIAILAFCGILLFFALRKSG